MYMQQPKCIMRSESKYIYINVGPETRNTVLENSFLLISRIMDHRPETKISRHRVEASIHFFYVASFE